MADQPTISIDAMGGDDAPDMVIDGIEIAARRQNDIHFLIFGDGDRLSALIDAKPVLKGRCTVRHADDVVTNDDKVATALRRKRTSSMYLAIKAVKDGEAAGVVSAGNTGVLMAMAKLVLRTLPGIHRPAIATVFPTVRSQTVMLDLGANVECDAINLVQFAVMGEVFAHNVLGLEKPSVGILNIGEEDIKGHGGVRRANNILLESSLDMKYHGFVEGDDIGKGTVDVVVTDGFTGNITLKTIEGTAGMIAHFMRQALTSSVLAKTGAVLASKALSELKIQLDPRRYNGAMFLGLNGICVKSHGGTDAYGFANAVQVADNLVRTGVNDQIRKDLELVTIPDSEVAAT